VNARGVTRRAFGLALSIVATALLVGAGPVGAANAFFFQQDGTFIRTGNDPVCTPNTNPSGTWSCDASMAWAFQGRIHALNSGNPDFPDGVYPGDRVCAQIDNWAAATASPPADTDPITSYDYACVFGAGPVSISQLDAATVAPTTIGLVHYDCPDPNSPCTPTGPGPSITVGGTWTGTGPISLSHASEHNGPSAFCDNLVVNGKDRDAIWPTAGLPFSPTWSFFQQEILTVRSSADPRCAG
jgi:hypothetical protein